MELRINGLNFHQGSDRRISTHARPFIESSLENASAQRDLPGSREVALENIAASLSPVQTMDAALVALAEVRARVLSRPRAAVSSQTNQRAQSVLQFLHQDER